MTPLSFCDFIHQKSHVEWILTLLLYSLTALLQRSLTHGVEQRGTKEALWCPSEQRSQEEEESDSSPERGPAHHLRGAAQQR